MCTPLPNLCRAKPKTEKLNMKLKCDPAMFFIFRSKKKDSYHHFELIFLRKANSIHQKSSSVFILISSKHLNHIHLLARRNGLNCPPPAFSCSTELISVGFGEHRPEPSLGQVTLSVKAFAANRLCFSLFTPSIE